MAAKNESHDTRANPSKSSPACRVRSGLTTAQCDDTDESTNNPPNHRVPTHSIARFLWVTPKDTEISELGERYQEWIARQESKQTDLSGWDQ